MIKSKTLTILLASQFKEIKTFMHKKFLRTTTAFLILSGACACPPAFGMEEYLLKEELNTTTSISKFVACPLSRSYNPPSSAPNCNGFDKFYCSIHNPGELQSLKSRLQLIQKQKLELKNKK